MPAEHMNNTVTIYNLDGSVQSSFLVTSPRSITFSNVNFSKITFSDTSFTYDIFITYKYQNYSDNNSYQIALADASFSNNFIPFTAAPVFAFGSIAFGVKATDDNGNSAAYYVPITVSNSESTATGSNFQFLLQFTPSDISSYINPNCENIFFGDSSGNLYDSWIENATSSTTSGSVNIWIKIPNINANSSETIYMYINSTTTTIALSTNHTGAQPQYTSTYGEYDNGANVFALYFNGNTPLTDFNFEGNTGAQSSVTGPSGTTINVISITGYASDFGFVYTGASLSNQPIIAESSSQQIGDQTGGLGADNGQVSIVSGTSTTGLNAIGVDMGYSSSYFSNDYYSAGTQTVDVNRQGTDNADWHYASVTYAGSSATSWSGYIAPQLYSTSGGYSGTVSNNPLSSSSTLYIGLIGSVTSNDQWQTYINWMRARAYPPNGVMPSVTFGSVKTAETASTITIFPQNTGIVYFDLVIFNTSTAAITFQIKNNITGDYIINESIPENTPLHLFAYDNNLVLNQQYTYTFTTNESFEYFSFTVRETY
jgi:hypothetical protein